MQRRRRSSIRHAATFAIAFTGIAIACGRESTEPGETSVADAAAAVAQVASAVTGQPSPLADEQLDGKHIGFDTHTYPGDKTMRAWKSAPGSPYRWVGYYLPAPCHKDRSWVGKRQALVGMGWGLAVVYVGQQTWGRTPRPSAKRTAALHRQGASCNADFLTTDRGDADALDAITVTQKEGFPPRSVVFLDIERMEKVPQAMRNYYRAWARRLLRDGRYLPGVYVHKFNAQLVHDDLKAEFAAAGVTEEPRIWVASGRGYEEGKAPQDVGFAFSGFWEGMFEVAVVVAYLRVRV
jgi:hypothetical protein